MDPMQFYAALWAKLSRGRLFMELDPVEPKLNFIWFPRQIEAEKSFHMVSVFVSDIRNDSERVLDLVADSFRRFSLTLTPMPTTLQHRLIRVAYRELSLNEQQQRTLLRSTAGVESHTDLTQAGFEDCLAVLEDLGFHDMTHSKTYWRDKAAARQTCCNERMARKIEAMAATCRYEIGSLCERFSEGVVRRVRDLKPREAWMLIEMLKAVEEREGLRTAEPG